MKSLFVVASLICGLGFFAPSAHATLLDGKTVSGEYLFSTMNSVYQNFGNVTVGSGVEFFNLGNIPVTLDISDTQLINRFGLATSWNAAPFNGYHISDVNNTIADFTSVSIDPSTNMAGLDLSRVTFDANNIWVNWNGLSFNNNTLVVLDVDGAAPVPEPSTIFLLGAGLAGLGIVRRRAKS
uniref:Ice-binding protein C-terminal domain-containing protein n=1 Tax=Geobacter sp. (strain M21) TaxID=443144 RepID=C6DYB4_GEOSM